MKKTNALRTGVTDRSEHRQAAGAGAEGLDGQRQRYFQSIFNADFLEHSDNGQNHC